MNWKLWNPYSGTFPLPRGPRFPRKDFTPKDLERFHAEEEDYRKSIVAFGLNYNPKGISVRHENCYKVAHQDPLTGSWRVTRFDSDGFPSGHDGCNSQAEAYYSALINGIAFESIPCPPYEDGTKEEIISRLKTQRDRPNDFITLLLFWRMDHQTIWELTD